MRYEKFTKMSVEIGVNEWKRLLERHRADVTLILKRMLIARITMWLRLSCFMVG
jgi:hypothetical protein